MKLNRFETLLMNNPIRAFVQRRYEAPRLARLASHPLAGADTLVIGCGRGVDVEICLEQYGVGRVTAFDFDEAQVQRAQKYLGDRYADRIRLQVADAAQMPFPDAAFDLVVDFGIIHHVPEWRRAVREVFRVLQPNGQFLFEEVPKKKLDTIHYRTFAEHPREDRFNYNDFRIACEEAGFVFAQPLEEFFGFFRGAALKQK